VVVLYSGDNDIASGKTPEQVVADFEAFVKIVRAALPGVKIVVLPVKPSASRLKHLVAQRRTNELLAARCKEDEGLRFVDVATPMLGADGKPRPELFRADRLHLNEEGYKLWTATLAPVLKKLAAGAKEGAARPGRPLIVGHRGLMRDAPENTLAGFAACLELGLGFELDVRRTRDGHLVCMHDADVRRTTDGKGAVSDLTLAELRRLDAGSWFDAAFAGQRVPTLEEIFALLQRYGGAKVLVALDIKVDGVEADLVRLAVKYGVLGRVVCIGEAISRPAVRRQLRQTDPATPAAVLAPSVDAFAAALADADAAWVYIRFVPTAEQTAAAHRAGKRVFLVGPLVAGNEPENWGLARERGVDALLTDYPLACRESWRSADAPPRPQKVP
jgi:glycerophosphoryl diester phosphodiesterase